MIGHIRGLIISKQAPLLIIDVNGIGYEVHAPMTTFYHLPNPQQEVSLFTHFIVREDAHQLYGFFHEQDRQLFRTLIKVNGVGPKLALTILSTMNYQQFANCIHQNNTAQLNNIPGIGKKTAERLLIEMRDKLPQALNSTNTYLLNGTANHDAPSDQHTQDAISALIALGYKSNEAKRSIKQIFQPNITAEELIRLSLQKMSKGD